MVLSIISCAYLLSVYLPWRNVCSSLFLMGYLSFYYWVVKFFFFNIVDARSLYDIWFAITSLILKVVISLSDSVFWRTKDLHFNEVQLTDFFLLVACVFHVKVKKQLYNPNSWGYLFMYSKSFIILCLWFIFI